MAALILCFWALLALAALGSRANGTPHTAVGPVRPLLDGAIHATLGTGLVAWTIPIALSVPNQLTASNLSLLWIGATAVLLVGCRRSIREGWAVLLPRLRTLLACPVSPLESRRTQALGRMGEGAWRLALVLLLGATLAAALLYPPNIWDSQSHHMPRIAQFEQNQTVAPFPTYYPTMNSTYPFASLVLTQIALLTGDLNAPLNLLQWFAYAISAALVYAIASQLGAGKVGARFATLVALSAPPVALQATTTQYDLTVGMWVLIAIDLTLRLMDEPKLGTSLLLGAAVGLGLATKVSMLLLFGPFVVWLVVRLVRSAGWKRTVTLAATAIAVTALVASPLFAMNVMLGGNILGTGTVGNTQVVVTDRSPGALWTNAVRNLACLAATPSDAVNDSVERTAGVVAALGGVPADAPINKEEADAQFALATSVFNPDLAGAPIQVLLITLSLLVLLLGSRRGIGPYAACTMTGLAAIAAVIAWQPFIPRTMTGSLLLLSPLAGVAVHELQSRSRHTADAGTSLRHARVGAFPQVGTIALWLLLSAGLTYGLAAVTFSATSPLAPRSVLTGGPTVETGWWNTPYEDRGWAGSLGYFVDDLNAARDAIGLPAGTGSVVLIGGDSATPLPVFPLISDLRDGGHLVVYEPRFGPGEWPGAHGDLLASGSEEPAAVVSFDPTGDPGTTTVGGGRVRSRTDYELAVSREVGELAVTVNVYVPVR